MQAKAVATMQYILVKLDPNNEQVKKTLDQWAD
jgi:hypothetical protein